MFELAGRPADDFPEASIVDFSFILAPPAGRYGFLSAGEDGHFYFQEGRRARFFGVNIAKQGVFADQETIKRVANVLARAGINLVRFHHFDGKEGLLDGARDDPLGYFNAKKLNALDFWVATLAQRGIYVYLDLLDYREFSAEEGVRQAELLGRGAKPCAVFDQRLIELQKEYATRLLRDHVNPYTGRCFADDPAVAFVEIFDENGLFARRTELLDLPSFYRRELTAQWNEWLAKRYGTTERLRAAWTGPDGQSALLPYESLEKRNVRLPVMSLRPLASSTESRGREGRARKCDGALFFYDVHRRFFRDMREHLRSIGVKVPIGAVGSLYELPDLKAIADSLDYVGTNFYWDHPSWEEGRAWEPPFFFANSNPLRETGASSAACRIAAAHIAQKPLVVREWSYCWPNEHRAAGTVELCALSALQDVDAIIAFTYDVPEEAGGIGFFDIHRDPLRWGIMSYLAKAFCQGEIAPARATAEIAYSHTDTFSFFGYLTPLYRLANVCRVQNRFYEGAWEGRADVTIASGRTAGGALRGKNLVIHNESRLCDLKGSEAGVDLCARSGYAIAPYWPEEEEEQTGDALPPGEGFDLGAVRRAGYAPVGAQAGKGFALGFYDAAKNNYVFRRASSELVLRCALEVLRNSGGEQRAVGKLGNGRFVSDTGEIVRNAREGVLRVVAPRFVAIANCRSPYRDLAAGPVEVQGGPGIYVLVATSLDGRPLAEAQRFCLKMVTRAQNEGQRVAAVPWGPKRFVISAQGGPKVRTMGRPWGGIMRIMFCGKELLRTYLRDGTWELFVDGERALLWCDTPEIGFVFREKELVVTGEQ